MLLQDEELDSLLNDEEAARNAQLGTTSTKPYDAAQPKKADAMAGVPSRFDESMRMGHSGAAPNPDFQPANKPSALEELLKFQSTPFSKPKQVDYQSMLAKQAADRQAMQSGFDPRIAEASKSVGMGRLFDSGVNALGGLRNSFREMANVNNPALKLGAVAPTNVMESDAVAKQRSILEEMARKYKGLEGQQDDELNIAKAQQSQFDKDYSSEKDARAQVLEAMKFRAEKERQYIDMGMKREDAKRKAEEETQRFQLDLRKQAEIERNNRAQNAIGLKNAERPNDMMALRQDQLNESRLQSLSKAIPQEQLDILPALKEIADKFGLDGASEIPGVSGMRGAMTTAPIVGGLAGFLPESMGGLSTTEKSNQALFQQLQNLDIKKLGGAAISPAEQQRFDRAKGMLGSRDPAVQRQGVRLMMESVRTIMKQREAGFTPEVVTEYTNRGGITAKTIDPYLNKPTAQPAASSAKPMITISKGDKTRQATQAEAEALSKLGWKVINGQ